MSGLIFSTDPATHNAMLGPGEMLLVLLGMAAVWYTGALINRRLRRRAMAKYRPENYNP